MWFLQRAIQRESARQDENPVNARARSHNCKTGLANWLRWQRPRLALSSLSEHYQPERTRPPLPPKKSVESRAGQHKMRRILIIEDERDIVELVRYNLEKEGFQVISVGAASRLRALLPRGPRPLPRSGRHRPGPGHHQTHCGGPRRPHLTGKRSRQRLALPLHPASSGVGRPPF